MAEILEIPGYTITSEIDRTDQRIIAKGVCVEDKKPVLLKILHNSGEASVDAARMRREVSIMQHLSNNTQPSGYKLINIKKAIVLVMDDFGSTSLRELAVRFPLPLNNFIEVATHLVFAVKELHRQGITHSLLHPGIILFSPDGNTVRLTDLESASLLTDEFTGFISLHHYDKSLLYMAPEQSGRMNRSVDFRSNLYSLGVIFYEMLTGKPVFESEDIVEIVYAHMAKMPVAPSVLNPAIPPTVEAIILKLLSKNAEERYQTTAGLLADLNTCLLQLDKTGNISGFQIGTEDFADKLSFPQKLYGREKEVSILLDGFQEAAEGNFSISMVGGYSGIGKSALVNEVNKPILKHRGYFISGKYDQLKKNIPYSALLQALRQLIMQVLSEPENSITEWRSWLLQKLKGNGAILTDVIPELELLIGKQLPLSELPVAEAQNRFRDTLAAFITAFAGKEHPLTLFIDDLQWADSSTIQFINRLAAETGNNYIYFIGAYRDNEVDGSHPLTHSLLQLAEQRVAVRQIILQPLSSENLNQFLSDTLKSDLETTKSLSQLIEKKTGANPFFLRAFVSRLTEDGLITYDKKSNGWTWNIRHVQQAEMTDNVVELLSQRIRKINFAAQELLKTAACLGNSFDLKTLAGIAGKSQQNTAKTLWDSLASGFILPLDENYKTAETLDVAVETHRVKYKFSHDRVQQAAYSLLSSDERQQTHLRIARSLIRTLTGDELEEQLFELANHFQQSISLIEDEEELYRVKELMLRVAQKAKEAVAYPVALQLLKTAIQFFKPGSWNENYTETAEAYLDLAECEYMCGNYSAAESLYALIEKNVTKKEHFARLYDIQLRQYPQQGRNKETLEYGSKILKQYGVNFIAEPSLLQVLPQLIKSKIMLAGKDIPAFADAPAMTDDDKLNAMKVLLNISATAYVYNANTMLMLVNKMTQLSVRYGNAPESPFGYGLFGFVEGAALGNFKNSELFSELSQKLNEKTTDPIISGKVKYLKSFATQHWYEPVKNTLPLLNESYNILVNNGSYIFASYALLTITSKELFIALPLNTIYKTAVEYSNFVSRVNEYYSQNLLATERRFISGLTGFYDENYRLADTDNFNEEKFIKNLEENRLGMAIGWHYVYTEALHYLFGNFKEAQNYLPKAALVDDLAPTTMPQIEHHFFKVLILANQYKESSAVSRIKITVAAKLGLRQLRKWAGAQKENFSARYLLAEAEWTSVTNPVKAEILFEQAVTAATQHKSVYIQALAEERWGKFLMAGNKPHKAEEHLKNAQLLWSEWGAAKKAAHLAEEFPVFFPKQTSAEKDSVPHKDTLSSMIDLESVLRSSQAISGEIVLGNLLKKFLKILMENVGAQKGFLILNRNNVLRIEAEAGMANTEPVVMQSEEIASTNKLSAAIINVVNRTGNPVLLNDGYTDKLFSADRYLRDNKVHSVLCVPVKNQGKVTAIAYFENNLATGAFTESRLNITTMLSAQAAISIENAILYDNLEQMVRDRTQELESEKKKSDDLLLNILPEEIATELKQKGTTAARSYDNVSVLFTDFVNFTQMSEQVTPQQLVDELHECFKAFDEIITKYNIEKIKTVGDAYIAASGLPLANPKHAENILHATIDILNFMIERRRKLGDKTFEVRIGIHSGTVIAGIVGVTKFAYDIWGDTVNTAARMEQNSEPGKINISQTTYELAKNKFNCEYRGEIEAKNKGKLKMYFVERSLI